MVAPRLEDGSDGGCQRDPLTHNPWSGVYPCANSAPKTLI